MSLDQALSSPRLHHQWKPDELSAEPLPASVQEKLKERGHTLINVRRSGAAQVVLKIGDHFEAAHDPRLEGKAAGW
jgi:gamma-glutamyltranspeptidase/glutathione hydrolase